jgi:hypothetical protein
MLHCLLPVVLLMLLLIGDYGILFIDALFTVDVVVDDVDVVVVHALLLLFIMIDYLLELLMSTVVLWCC